LAAAVEQLEVMDTLFQAGMRPQGDQYLLHDLKLKYGRSRLQSIKSSHSPRPSKPDISAGSGTGPESKNEH
jgi:hypothetical protein